MNPKIQITKTELLSDNWYLLNKVTFEFTPENGEPEIQRREVYDRGNGAAILLYNKAKQTVILTRQFRLPTFLNGNESGMMIEVCAGLLDEKNPEDCIKRETEEETGYRIQEVKKVFEAYMSPGAVTEILYFFTAEYQPEMKVSEGGGLASEHEYIEVMELNFNQAMEMVYNGEIKDAKTIMLLLHAKNHQLL
ncbi:GDP-mannose pyrophosphatase NudK [Flavobacterium azooxidireducens]|uniref:GDP-mannose pyrophosphatase n=1 Tax=Flavobacterium azooxidireducens TaxID=1871076 RepID=A0ABY4KCF6_9FLAO|nr:GDP-mannose pyrophosphatase NudK [Flavobacterium azooxidireducens]UPQ78394.1 GDP-mannose pyrophosphatase NudK [Flavobacterium azooxidireducens]